VRRLDSSEPVFDCTGPGVTLPLALRQAAGTPTTAGPQETGYVTCGECGVRYAARPAGSFLPEDGRCRACATRQKPKADVLPLRRGRRSAA